MFNLVTVLFGIFSVKEVNIPLFLTFRRCAILSTVALNYLIKGIKPDLNLWISTILISAGAIVAGADSLNEKMLGYFYIIMNNVTQSGYNIYV